MRAGDVDGALRALRAAAEHARRLDDPERLAQTALASTLGAFSPGVVEPELVAHARGGARAPGRARAATSPLRRATIDALRCRLRVQLALALYWSPQRERREQLVDEALGARARDLQRRGGAQLAGAAHARRPHAGVRARAGLRRRLGARHRHARAADLASRRSSCASARTTPSSAMQVRLWRISLLLELDDPRPRRRGDRGLRRDRAPPRPAADARLRPAAPRDGGAPARRLRRRRALHRRGRRARRATCPARSRRSSPTRQTFLAAPHAGPPRSTSSRSCARNADRLPAMRRWRCGLALVLAELGREDEARRELEHLAADDFDDLPRDALVARRDVAARRAVRAARRPPARAPPLRAARRPTRAATSSRWAPPTSARSRATSACWR